MRVVASADWRDGIPFESPFVLADLLPGEPARCSVCGGTSEPVDRTQLWGVKHRHPKNHDGFVRFYCADHRPAVAPAPVAPASARPAKAPRRATPRRMEAPERPAVMCPDCFVEVPATGVCGMCGQKVS